MFQSLKTSDSRANGLLAIGVASLFAIKKLFIWDYGFNPDLGHEFENLLDLIDGKMVYKDFVWIYGPFCLYYYYALHKFFGLLGIDVAQATVAIVGTLACYFACRAASFVLRPVWASVSALLAFSSLVAPVHVSGHIFSILSFIAALYYVLLYVERGQVVPVIVAGLFCGFSLLNKPIHYGGASIIGGVVTIVLNDYFFAANKFKSAFLFLLSATVLPLLVYGAILTIVPLQSVFYNVFPMYSGYFNKASSFFYLKEIFPVRIFSVKSLAEVQAVINSYLGESVRWWMMWFVAFGGFAKVVLMYVKEKTVSKSQVVLFSLAIHSLLMEFQVLVVPHQFASYVNMFPTYVLLCYFVSSAVSRWLRTLGIAFVAGWFALFFVYSSLNHYRYFKKNGVPLGQKYAENIIATPHQKNLYDSVVREIQHRTVKGDKIVVADFDPFVYVFSGRERVFPEDNIVFLKTSFHPYNRGGYQLGYSSDFFDASESAMVKKVVEEKPQLILIPKRYLDEIYVKDSVFLQYLLNDWKLAAEVGGNVSPGPFSGEKTMSIFEKKPMIERD